MRKVLRPAILITCVNASERIIDNLEDAQHPVIDIIDNMIASILLVLQQ